MGSWAARSLLTCLLLLLCAHSGHSQLWTEQPPPRVRITIAESKTVGIFHNATDTTFTIRTPSGLLRFVSRDISMLERSMGRRPNILTGIVGLIAGAAIGGAIGCAANNDDYGVFCGGQDDTKVIAGATAGGAAGALLGALLWKRERWEIADFPMRHDVR